MSDEPFTTRVGRPVYIETDLATWPFTLLLAEPTWIESAQLFRLAVHFWHGGDLDVARPRPVRRKHRPYYFDDLQAFAHPWPGSAP